MATSDPSNGSNGRFRRPAIENAASPAQCRIARALLRWSQQELSIRASVARKTIGDFEAGARTLRFRTRLDITRAFEDAGIVFDENDGARLTELAATTDGVSSVNPGANGHAGNGTARLTQPLSRLRWGRRSDT